MENIKSQDELSQRLKELGNTQGFNPIGIAKVPGSEKLQLRNLALEKWLEAGYQADMHWMEAKRRKNIDNLLPGVKSVLSVGLNYYTGLTKEPYALSIARYGWGKDYHKVIKKRLKVLGHWLQEQRPSSKWKICVDADPLLEKAWAEEAGIGWIGKHSNLINPKAGSWILLGHLLTTEELTPDKRALERCGKCKECITACPTQAITKPFVVDANRCLAYHTIENRNPELPKEIEESLGSWIAGCDICQEVCPWNKKKIPINRDPAMQPQAWMLQLTTDEAVSWDEKTWKEKLKGTALKRVKPWMWKRNGKIIERQKSSMLNKQ